MKFSSVIVALFAAASVYSKTTFKTKSDLVRHLKETSPDCAAELSKYEVCILTPTSSKDCTTIKGSSCSSFYSNPDKYVGHCIGNKKISLFTSDSLSNLKSEYKEVCKKLENKDKTTSVVKKTTTLTKKSKTSAAASSTASAAPTAAQATSASKPEATSAAASASATSAATSNASTATNAPANDANAQATTGTQDANAQTANSTQDANAQAANGATQDANAPLSAPVAGTNSTANNGNSTVTNIVTGNSTTQNNPANVEQSSDATKLTVSLLVTIALVMLSF